MDYVPLNFSLLSNPMNWLTVLVMIFVAGLALSLLFHRPLSGDFTNLGDAL